MKQKNMKLQLMLITPHMSIAKIILINVQTKAEFDGKGPIIFHIMCMCDVGKAHIKFLAEFLF